MIAKENRDAATADLPEFFLPTEREGEDLMLPKLAGDVALLLVESEPEMWKNHLKRRMEHECCMSLVMKATVAR